MVESLRNDTFKVLAKANVMPLLVDNRQILYSFTKELKPKLTVIDAQLSAKELGLTGQENAPTWFDDVCTFSDSDFNLLIIDNIFSLPKNEQMKFYELLKYRNTGNFELPQNCFIVLMGDKETTKNISPVINALIARLV